LFLQQGHVFPTRLANREVTGDYSVGIDPRGDESVKVFGRGMKGLRVLP